MSLKKLPKLSWEKNDRKVSSKIKLVSDITRTRSIDVIAIVTPDDLSELRRYDVCLRPNLNVDKSEIILSIERDIVRSRVKDYRSHYPRSDVYVAPTASLRGAG